MHSTEAIFGPMPPMAVHLFSAVQVQSVQLHPTCFPPHSSLQFSIVFLLLHLRPEENKKTNRNTLAQEDFAESAEKG